MLKGRGAQYNPGNPFSRQEIVKDHSEGIDIETSEENPKVQFLDVVIVWIQTLALKLLIFHQVKRNFEQ